MADHLGALETRLCEILAMKHSFEFTHDRIVACLSVPFRQVHAIVMADIALCTSDLSLDQQLATLQIDGARGRYKRARQSAALCAYTRERIIEVFFDLDLDHPSILPLVPVPMEPAEHVRVIERHIEGIAAQNARIEEELQSIQASTSRQRQPPGGNMFDSFFDRVIGTPGGGDNGVRIRRLTEERAQLESQHTSLCGQMAFYRSIVEVQDT